MRGRGRWSSERGSALVVSATAMVALLGAGLVSLSAVRSETAAAGTHRFQAVAFYAAESGAAAAMDFARSNYDAGSKFSALVNASNTAPLTPSGIVGNGVEPGGAGYPFSAGSMAWYEVTLLNNAGDGGFVAGDDLDGILIARVVGHGPDDARAVVEVTIRSPGVISSGGCERTYAQENVNGLNDTAAACATSIDLAAGLRTASP